MFYKDFLTSTIRESTPSNGMAIRVMIKLFSQRRQANRSNVVVESDRFFEFQESNIVSKQCGFVIFVGNNRGQFNLYMVLCGCISHGISKHKCPRITSVMMDIIKTGTEFTIMKNKIHLRIHVFKYKR